MSPQSQRNPYEIHWQLNELGNRPVSAAPATAARPRTPAPAPRRASPGSRQQPRGRAA